MHRILHKLINHKHVVQQYYIICNYNLVSAIRSPHNFARRLMFFFVLSVLLMWNGGMLNVQGKGKQKTKDMRACLADKCNCVNIFVTCAHFFFCLRAYIKCFLRFFLRVWAYLRFFSRIFIHIFIMDII